MLTSKIHKIADDIGYSIIANYEPEYLETIFSLGLSIEDVIFQVLVICCRDAFLINSKTHPLSYFIEKDGAEAELARKEHGRIIKYINDKNDLLDKYLQQNIGERLKRPDTNLTKKNNRFPEYEFTEFQYWELKNIHDMKLLKSIIERRISSSKKVSIDRFKEFSKQYDSSVTSMRSIFGKDSASTVFSSIQFFTLQTKYSFDFLYEVSVKMEKLGIKQFYDMKNRLLALTSCYKSESKLPDICPKAATDADRNIKYPLIIQRRRIVDLLVSESEDIVTDLVLGAFIEANVLANAIHSHMQIDNLILPLYFAKETDIDDWASVFDVYNVFRTFAPEKTWTDARIKSARKMYDCLSIDYKKLRHPENRP